MGVFPQLTTLKSLCVLNLYPILLQKHMVKNSEENVEKPIVPPVWIQVYGVMMKEKSPPYFHLRRNGILVSLIVGGKEYGCPLVFCHCVCISCDGQGVVRSGWEV